jgi:glycosyltransferase involved in cell wall biosynthesis
MPAFPNSSRILLIAYYFPPLGMGGTQRLAKWCKYFKRLGATPTVVTVKPIAYYAVDDSLLADLEGVNIIRTESLDPSRVLFHLHKERISSSQANRRSWMAWLFVPDSRVLWLPFALWRGIQTLRREQHLAVVTSGPPHSSHFLGWLFKKIFGTVWLADFRDSWSGGDFQPEPTPLHRRLNLALERFILKRADVLTSISYRLAGELATQSGAAEINIRVIANGYDPDDFLTATAPDRIFTVAFCGAITRIADPQTLIEGFRAFVEMAQAGPQDARLRFIGADLTGKVAEWIRGNGLEEYAAPPGYVGHAEAIAAMRRASVLAYLAAPGTSEVYIGGKTYEYLAARRPVLCIGVRVDGMAILQKYAATRVCDFYDIDAIARALLAFYREFSNAESPAATGDVPIDFSRGFQAEQILGFIIDAAGTRSTG